VNFTLTRAILHGLSHELAKTKRRDVGSGLLPKILPTSQDNFPRATPGAPWQLFLPFDYAKVTLPLAQRIFVTEEGIQFSRGKCESLV